METPLVLSAVPGSFDFEEETLSPPILPIKQHVRLRLWIWAILLVSRLRRMATWRLKQWRFIQSDRTWQLSDSDRTFTIPDWYHAGHRRFAMGLWAIEISRPCESVRAFHSPRGIPIWRIWLEFGEYETDCWEEAVREVSHYERLGIFGDPMESDSD